MTWRASLLGFLCLFSVSTVVNAQDDPLGWNTRRALEMMDRARMRRDLPRGDSTLQNYTAKANGFVYFYLDRREDNERTLVKVDQIAIDLYWKTPDRTKQRIVGLRDVSKLPNRMYYHLDHLTVVQNGLGDVIKIGDGDEVRDVPHPAAAGADSIYDFRLADSVTITLGGDQGSVRVYEIQVRPKRTNRSAMIGSVFVDRASADIVRMNFTFTPASYVDRRLDYINISLDNGLFAGSYWLPAEQSVEIRRQLPELDFAAGAVIKGRLRIGSYEFNQPISDTIFWGRPVSAVSEAQRRAYPFEQDIYSDVAEAGLAPTPRMEELQELAEELVGVPRLSGLPSWRFYIPNASSVARHNEAEGWYGGVGVTYVPSATFRTDFTAGYAFGADKPELTAATTLVKGDVAWKARAYFNEPRDIGPIAGNAGVINTFTSLWGDRDYTDLYFARGASLHANRARGRWQPGLMFRAEQHRPGFTPRADVSVAPFLPGTAFEAALTLSRPYIDRAGSRVSADFQAGYVNFAGDHGVRLLGTLTAQLDWNNLRTTLNARADAGLHSGARAGQFRFLLGGRETVPGHDYRSMQARAYQLTRFEFAHTIAAPLLRARLLYDWLQTDKDHASSYGVGAGLLWDVIRVDFMKGDYWQAVISVRRDFWDML